MASPMRCLGGALLTAAAMYWFDPTSGRRRRARLRDRLIATAHDARHGIDVAGRDLANRIEGLTARTRSLFDAREVPDAVLAERVRAALGRVVSHPGAIEVHVMSGCAALSGDVLAHEVPQLLRAVRAVRGVRAVEDRLGVHLSARGIPALQGGRPRQPRRFELMQENWTPAARLLTAVAGGALALRGVRGGPFGVVGAMAGGTLLVRSLTNMPLRRLAGAAGRRAIDIHKTMHVKAPVDQVFGTLERYESYPLFMRNVLGVRRHPDGRWRWRVVGPAGVPVEWDSELTAFEPNRVIAWRSVRNASVQHAGIVRFEPEDGGTRLDIRMSYNPPAGALGHAMARLLGTDPKSRLEQDLVRLKTFIETGRIPRDAAGRALAEIPTIGAPEPMREPAGEAPPAAARRELDGGEPLH